MTVVVDRGSPVKLSFFGLSRRRVKNPETTDDAVVRVASLLDIAAFKMAVLPARAEAKDYLDVHALLQNGVALSDALGAARAVYGEQFNPMITLKALTYFSDGNLPTLPKNVQQSLREAAIVKQIAHFDPLPGGLVPPETQLTFPDRGCGGILIRRE